MNPRQRRGLIYLLIAVVVAIATFLTVTRYVASVNSQVGSRVTVYRAKTAFRRTLLCQSLCSNRLRCRVGGLRTPQW